MLSVLAIITPIFLVIGIGYLLTRKEVIPKEALPVLSRLLLFCLIPALTFGTVAQLDFAQVEAWDFLGVYGLGSLLAMTLAVITFRLLLGVATTASAIRGLCSSMSNSIFIGYPLVIQAFGAEWGFTFIFAVMIENIIMIPTALILAEWGQGRSNGASSRVIPLLTGIIKRLSTNPIILAMVSGLAYSFSGLDLPDVADRTLTVLGNAAGGVALLVIGGSLVGNPIRGNMRDIGTVATLKLAAHPLMVALVLWFWPDFDNTLQALVIVYAAMPMAAIIPILGSPYGQRDFCASSLVATTLSAFFSLTLVLSLVLT